MDALARDVEEQPDACQHERAAHLGCSQRGISDALQRLAISRKKTFRHRGVTTCRGLMAVRLSAGVAPDSMIGMRKAASMPSGRC